MKTFECVTIIRWFEKDNGSDRRPVTITCENKVKLLLKLYKIKTDFMTNGDGKEGELPYSVRFEITEKT